ncbi:cytochrome c [Rhodobacteraceae bacterium R_SAG10]|nr:cytochrome c [Rhodobacteraceae bacterium R_SAG10]
MPAFPDLGAEEIAAVAGYIRNAWVNDFGPASVDEVAAVLDWLEDAGPRVSVWTGVYTEEQANRGKAAHRGTCTRCHGRRLNGAGEPDMEPAPDIARIGFLQRWDGQSVATLFAFVHTTMPPSNPGFLSDQDYLDAIAYIFQVSGMPAGDSELPLDPVALAGFVIVPKPEGG